MSMGCGLFCLGEGNIIISPLGSCAYLHNPPIRLPCEAPMPFTLRPYRRFPVCCPVTYHAGPFQGQGTIWNLSCTGWRLSGDLPMRSGESFSLTVTLPNEQRIVVPEAVVRWSRGQEFAAENRSIEPHTQTRLQHYVNRLVQEPTGIAS